MKNGLTNEYLINMVGPNVSYTGANPSFSSLALNNLSYYTGRIFVAPYDMSINRMAFVASTVGNSNLVAGLSTTNSSGQPTLSGTTIVWIASSTISALSLDYNQVSFNTTTILAGSTVIAAIQPSTITSAHTIVAGITNGTLAATYQFPYGVSRSVTGITAVSNLTNICLGYNNGSYTQWYGNPCVTTPQNQNLNTSTVSIDSAGCEFLIPSSYSYLSIKAVGMLGQKASVHQLTCRIFDSDNSTQINNATSSIATSWSTDTAAGWHFFHFTSAVILNTYKTYYLRFYATGTSASGTALNYIRVASSALSTSNSIAAEFQNAFDITNNFATWTTSAVMTKYTNARASVVLMCETKADSFRGTKENGYVGY